MWWRLTCNYYGKVYNHLWRDTHNTQFNYLSVKKICYFIHNDDDYKSYHKWVYNLIKTYEIHIINLIKIGQRPHPHPLAVSKKLWWDE